MSKKNPFRVQMTEREKELMAVGRPVQCSACRETSYIYPKAVGHHPYEWEMNCSQCHRYAVGLNAYEEGHEGLIRKLEGLRTRYLAGETSEQLAKEVSMLTEDNDVVLLNSLCECGGSLSIAARPKCIFCDIEISDSFFHVADESASS
jgi:hypothetical protein